MVEKAYAFSFVPVVPGIDFQVTSAMEANQAAILDNIVTQVVSCCACTSLAQNSSNTQNTRQLLLREQHAFGTPFAIHKPQ
eukprot:4046755-Amphidinium_carterae.1